MSADKPYKVHSGTDDDKPGFEIPRKPKAAPAVEAPPAEGDRQAVQAQDNGVPATNGKRKASDILEEEYASKKRAATEGNGVVNSDAKSGRITENGNGVASNEAVIVDDDANGAILIDDD